MSAEFYDSIFEQFLPVSAEIWKEKIIRDLKGDTFDKLIWHSKEGIDILPFYTKEDNEKYQLQIPHKFTTGWQITERIVVEDIKEANRVALHALSCGATTILFNLRHQQITEADADTLLNGILLDVAPVIFEDYTEEDCTLLEKKIPNSCVPMIRVPQQETITDELLMALKLGSAADFKLHRFYFYIGQNYFFEIAKLRAFRWLWNQFCQLKKQSIKPYIFCETGVQKRDGADEYSNMLRNTTEAMSAVLGGSDAVIINSHDVLKGNTDFGKRIARNIHHILQQEVGYAEISDAAKGSYYIEYLTYKLAQKTWEKFQNV